MSCARSGEIDLMDFLAEPGSRRFAAFRAHYPGCADCAAEVRAWTELHELLAVPGQTAHPEPELLAGYAQLAGAARAAVDAHLRRCPACREELSQLASFEPGRLAVGAEETRGEPRALLLGLKRLLWSPAFAYAVAAAVIVPTVYRGGLAPWREAVPWADGGLRVEAPPHGEAAPTPGGPTLAAPPAGETAGEPRAARERDAAAKRVAPPAPPRPAEPPPLRRAAEPSAPPADLRPSLAAPQAARPPPPRVAQRPAEAPPALAAGRVAEALPSLRAERPGAGAELESADAVADRAPGEERAPALWLAPDSLVDAVVARGSQLVLRVPVPAGTAATGEAELRIATANGRRELVERRALPPAGPGRALDLRVPRDWLSEGVYRVELRIGDEPRIHRFSLRVDVP